MRRPPASFARAIAPQRALARGRRDQRPHLAAGILRLLHHHPPDRVGQRVTHVRQHRLLADHPAGGRALLAGVAHRGRRDHAGCRLDVRVGQHHCRVLATHLALRSCAPLRQRHRHPVTDRLRPRERDGRDSRMRDQRRARLAGTLCQLDGAIGQCVPQQLEHRGRARRRVLARLPHADVAVRQRRRQLPERYGHREVPGRDQPHHSPRLPPRHQQRAPVRRRERLAVRIERHLRVKPQDRDRPRQLAASLRDRLSDLAHDQCRQLLRSRLQRVRDRRQPGPARRCRGTRVPAGGRRRVLHRPVDLDAAGRRHGRHHVVGRRRVDADDLGRRGGHRAAAAISRRGPRRPAATAAPPPSAAPTSETMTRSRAPSRRPQTAQERSLQRMRRVERTRPRSTILAHMHRWLTQGLQRRPRWGPLCAARATGGGCGLRRVRARQVPSPRVRTRRVRALRDPVSRRRDLPHRRS